MKLQQARASWFAVWTTIAVLIGLAPVNAETINRTKEWIGHHQDGNLKKKKQPANGFITNKEVFAKLWKAWMGKKPIPEIDFAKEVVLVASSSKGAIRFLHLVNNNGDCKVAVGFTPKDVKGFTFTLATFKREGIKTIYGKPLKK